MASAIAAFLLAPAAFARDEPPAAADPKPRIYKEVLVERALKDHPELLALDLHQRPPAAPPCVVADSRIAVEVKLRDRAGKDIGAVRAVYKYADGDGHQRYLVRAEALSGEIRRKIPAAGRLVQPVRSAEGYDVGGTRSLPTTKQVVSGRTLAENEQDGYAEAVKNVTGVAPANSKGSANDSIYIRGIKLNLFSNYRLNGGLPVAGVITMPVEDKARLETLKGANALQFGVASPAGIIDMVTKRAPEKDVLSVSAAGSTFGQVGGTFDVSHRFGGEGQFGMRLNGSVTRLQNGVHGLGGDGEFGSAGLDYRMTERLTLQGDFEYYRKRLPEQAGISLLDPVNGAVRITPVPDPRNLLSGPWAMYTPETTNAQLRADYAVTDGLKIVAEGGRSYSARSRFSTRIGGYDPATGAGGTVRVSSVLQDYRNSFGMLELQAAFATAVLRHQLTFGGSVTDRRAETPLNYKEQILPDKQNIFNPVGIAAPVFTGTPSSLPLNISRDGGVYAYDTISFHPRAPRLLLGLRYTQDYENNGKVRDPVSCPNCGPSTTWEALPAFGALWDVMAGVTLFGSYMEGLEAGGTAPTNAFNANEILPSAVSKQKEVGIRTTFRALNASLSLFDIDRANAVTDPNPNAHCNGNPGCFVNSGRINYKGLELTVRAELGALFALDAGWQWLRARQNSPDPKFNGFAPENTPRGIANGKLTFRMPGVTGLSLNGGASGVTGRYVNFQQQGTIPGYVLFSGGATWAFSGGVFEERRVTMLLNVDNVANLRYWNSVQTGTYGIGMDRSVKMTIKADL